MLAMMLTSCERNGSPDTLRESLDNLIGMEQQEARVTEMREFLWEHWVARKPADLLLTAVSKEGGVSHSEYRILLLPGNTLVLKVTIVRDHRGYQGQVIPKPERGYEAYTVERVASKNPFGIGADAVVTILAANASVPPSKYWLRFRGWDGVAITYF